jgi:arylsulfatase A-like enzyme
MSEQTGWSEPVKAVVVCAAALLLFDAGFNLARGSAIPIGYWLLILASSLALAGLVGAVAASRRWGARSGLALWLGLEAFAWNEGSIPRQLSFGVAFGLLTWALLGARLRRRAGPLPAALSVACSFGLATLIWPRLGAVLGIGARQGVAEDLWTCGVFAVALALLTISSFVAPRRWPGSGWVAAVVMLALLLGAHLAYRRARPETADPRPAARSAATAGELPSIIVLVLDTVRADVLTIYGSESDTTPHLQRFVEQSDRAVVFPWAFAPSNWTIPSHVSLLTGLLPSAHGAHEGARGLRDSPFSAARLRADRTLAEALGARGYRTAFLTANPTLLRVQGIDRGFDVLRQPRPPRPSSLIAERLRGALAPSLLAGSVGETPKARRVAAELIDFLGRGPGPVFAVANFMEPHTPYTPPWAEAGLFSGRRTLRGPKEVRVVDAPATVELARRRYLEEIRALDRQLGALLEELEAAGYLERSWLVITSDHGEAFMEHGSTNHGGDLYNEQVRVPLVIQTPRGGSALRAEAPVSLVDLATTLAAVAGVRGFGTGRDLTATDAAVAPVVIEFFGNTRSVSRRFAPDGDKPATAVVERGLKLIRRVASEELYELTTDPAERVDRLAERLADAERLRATMPPLPTDPTSDRAAERDLSYDEIESLRALGYID